MLARIEHSREGSIQRVVSRDLDRRREVEATEADRDSRARGRVDVLLALEYRREQSVNDARGRVWRAQVVPEQLLASGVVVTVIPRLRASMQVSIGSKNLRKPWLDHSQCAGTPSEQRTVGT